MLALSGTAGRTGGAVWCAIAYAPVVALAWFVLAPARRRVALTAGVAVVTVVLGFGTAALAPPSIERVDHLSSTLPVPAEARLMSVDALPNDWCTQGCSSVERLYAVPDASAAIASLQAALKADGWRPVQARWCRGAFGVQVSPVRADDPRFESQSLPSDGDEAMLVVTRAEC